MGVAGGCRAEAQSRQLLSVATRVKSAGRVGKQAFGGLRGFFPW